MFHWWEHVIAEVQQVHMLSNYFIKLKKIFYKCVCEENGNNGNK